MSGYSGHLDCTDCPDRDNRPTLLIIGYYHLADGFRACANFLEKDYRVLFFPLLHYQNNNINFNDILIKYIDGKQCDKYESNVIPNTTPVDIVFLWYYRYFCADQNRIDLFLKIKNAVHPGVIFIAYNWDPLPPTIPIHPHQIAFYSCINRYLSGDAVELDELRKKGVYNAEYCPSGFDPRYSYYLNDSSFQCDVSVVCTNLYSDYNTFPLEYVRYNRKRIIDLIYQNRNQIRFHIYGPESFKDLYPECYRGYINYMNCLRVFSNSKLNLCIHAVSYNSRGKELYFSERLPQILGCKGLLYCETEYHYLLRPDINYVLLDKEDPINQIKNIISQYDTEKYCMIRDNGYRLAMSHFTWDAVRQKVNTIH